MLIKRFFYYWQFIAAVAIPAWMFVSWGLFSPGGWSFLGLLIVAPIVFVALIGIATIISIRPGVRRARAVSWVDAGLLTVWHASLVAFGFYGDFATLFVVLAILVGVATFWVTLGELVRTSARRVSETMDEFERVARGGRASSGPRDVTNGPGAASGRGGDSTPRDDDPDVYIVRENPE